MFLTGFMGSGKSTLGRRVAETLQLRFVDLDSAIEGAAKRRISEIFSSSGEAGFRALERQALQAALTQLPALDLIALGGGAWPHNLDLIPSQRVIFIELPFGVLLKRALVGGNRPLAKSREQFEALWREREPLYRRAGHVIALSESDDVTVAAQHLITLLRHIRYGEVA
jgi:shikimate kinase